MIQIRRIFILFSLMVLCLLSHQGRADNGKVRLVVSDFPGATRSPVVGRAMSQQLANLLGTHPNITLVTRAEIQQFLKQSGQKKLSASQIEQVVDGLKADAFVSGEISEEEDSMVATIRIYGGKGQSLGSRRLSSSLKEIGRLPSDMAGAVTESLRLAAQNYPKGSNNLSSIADFGEGLKLADEGQYLKAGEKFQQAKEKDIDFRVSVTWQKEMAGLGLQNSQDPIERARFLMLSGEREKALEELKKVDLKAAGVSEKMLQAQILIDSGQFAQAETQLNAVLASSGEDPDALFNLGRVMRATGRPDKAILALEKAQLKAPGRADIVISLGELYQVNGNFVEAAKAFIKGGDLGYDLENYDAALLLYRRAKSLDPANSEILLREAKTLLKFGLTYEAVPLLENADQQLKNNGEIKAYLGKAYFQQGQNAKAQKTLQEAISLEPENFEANLYLGLVLRKEAGENKAKLKLVLPFLMSAAGINPEDRDVNLALARVYRDLGEINEAKKYYEILQREFPDDFSVAKEFGDFYRQSGSYLEAESMYGEAIRLNPDFIDAREGLSESLKKQGKEAEALEVERSLKKIDPDSGLATTLLIKQIKSLVIGFPTRVRLDDEEKYVQQVAVIDYAEVKAFSGESGALQLRKKSFFDYFLTFRTVKTSEFNDLVERALQAQYSVRYNVDIRKQVDVLGGGYAAFQGKPFNVAAMKGICEALNVDAVFLLEVMPEGVSAEHPDQYKFRLFLTNFEKYSGGLYRKEIVVTFPKKGYLGFNPIPLLPFLFILAGVAYLIFRRIKLGAGDVRVSIRFDKETTAGYFSLKLSKKQDDPWATRVGKGKQKFSKKAAFSSKTEEYMVGDVTVFKKFTSGPYFVHLFGNISDIQDKKKVIGTFSTTKAVTVKKNQVAEVEFKLTPDEAFVEVHVNFQGQKIIGAEVTCVEINKTSVTRADGGAQFHLKKGKYKFSAVHEDLVANSQVSIDNFDAKEVSIELHEANRFVKKGDFVRAAQIFQEQGDDLEASRMYEKSGDLLKACRVLGEKFVREENFEKALACYQRANDYENLAATYQRMNDMPNAYRNFGIMYQLNQEHDDAIKMFQEAKAFDMVAQCYAEKGDAQNQNLYLGKHHADKGQDLEAAGAFERAGAFEEAGQAYERVNNLLKAGEMFVKANKAGYAGDLFQKAGDTTRAAMAYEKGGQLEKAAELYKVLGDTSKAPKMLLDAGKFLDAARAYRGSGLLDEALSALRKVATDHADFLQACDLMADIFDEKGEPSLAVQSVLRSVQNIVPDSNNLDRFYAVGQRLEKSGEIGDAVKMFEKVLAVNLEYKDLAHHVRDLKEKLQAQTKAGSSPLLSSQNIPSTTTAGMFTGSSRYEILKELGRGGMGIVYHAKDKLLEREVAFKLLPDHIKDNPDAMQAFIREAKSAAKMQHPNLVTIFDTGAENGSYFITMELVEGQTLKQVLQKSSKLLRPADIVNVSIMICEGLSYAHQNKVIHRDVKPSNVMIGKNKQVKIMDFGLATVMQAASLDKTMMRGTPLYMAPEMILGRNVDYRSDIYSMGISIYEMATKRVPFPSGDVAYHHLHTPPTPPNQINPNLPTSLNDLILKAIAKKQEDRFQSMDEMLATLNAIKTELAQAQTASAAG